MRYIVSAVTIAASVWIGLAAESIAQDNLDAVKQLQASINAVDHLSLSIDSTTVCVNEIEEFGLMNGRRLSEVVRCGDREKVSTREFIDDLPADSEYYKSEYQIYASGAVVAVQAFFDSSGKQKPVDVRSNLMLMLSDKKLVSDGAKVRDRLAVYCDLQESGCAIWVVGRSPLVDYLRRSDSQQNLSVEGMVLSATGQLGRVELKLSPEHGWLPDSFFIEKQADSAIGNETVRSFFSMKPLPASIVLPRGAIPEIQSATATSMSWRGDVTKFEQTADGVWYPAELTLVYRTQFANGGVNTATSQIKVTPIPDTTPSPCDLTINIPANYVVTVEKASHLPYRWDGTYPEPGVPDFPEMEAYKTVPLRRSSRPLLILVNLAIIAALVVMLIVRKRRSKEL